MAPTALAARSPEPCAATRSLSCGLCPPWGLPSRHLGPLCTVLPARTPGHWTPATLQGCVTVVAEGQGPGRGDGGRSKKGPGSWGEGQPAWPLGSSTPTLKTQAGAQEAEPRHGHTLWGRLSLLNAPAKGLSGLTSLGPGAGGDHEALGEDAEAAVTVALQPRLVHCRGGGRC